MPVEFQPRHALAADWASDNPILKMAEKAYEEDTNLWKTGDGILHYNSLPYDPTGAGTVTSVSVVTANGLGGSVATSTTTPAITLTTGITGVLKGNGTAISAATPGTDYYAPGGTDVAITDGGTGVSTLPSGLLKGAGTGAITAGAQGTDYWAPGGTDVALADGGTGASSASAARTNLGLVIGTDVLAPTGSGAGLSGIYLPGGTDVAVADGGTGASTASAARTNLGLVIGTDVLAPTGSAASLTSFPTLNQNTSGTAANLSGTPALPNGTTATTQTAADNSTKLATTAYADVGLALKAPLASPTFTGTVTLPTGLSGVPLLTAGVVSAAYVSQLTSTQTTSNTTTETTQWTATNMAAAALVANTTLLRVRIGGTLDTINTTGGTFTGNLYVNTTLVAAIGVIGIQQTGGALSAQAYWVDLDLYVDSTGSLGTVSAVGGYMAVTTAGGGFNPRAVNGSTGSVSLTGGLQLVWKAKMTVANAGCVFRTTRASVSQVA